MNKIKITKAGPFTTIQDKGRWGYQRFGISVAGAMDHFATRVANILVKNEEYAPVLESTFLGPEILFYCDEVISITGANMKPKLNNQPIPMWTSIKVKPGDKLSFSSVVSGLRAYIGFSKGLDIPKIMGSSSTFVRGKLGGFKGRKLANDDEINLGNKEPCSIGSYLSNKFIPVYNRENTIRVVMGPQDDYFHKESIETFLNSNYKITSEADRMGYRLDGPKIVHKTGADIISDGIVFGSIQVPGDGSPILMMADRATTGGYTKIATVITPDLSVLAQMSPGDSINFKAVSIYQSHQIYKEYENKFKEIGDFINNHRFKFDKIRKFNLTINKKTYTTSVYEIE